MNSSPIDRAKVNFTPGQLVRKCPLRLAESTYRRYLAWMEGEGFLRLHSTKITKWRYTSPFFYVLKIANAIYRCLRERGIRVVRGLRMAEIECLKEKGSPFGRTFLKKGVQKKIWGDIFGISPNAPPILELDQGGFCQISIPGKGVLAKVNLETLDMRKNFKFGLKTLHDPPGSPSRFYAVNFRRGAPRARFLAR